MADADPPAEPARDDAAPPPPEDASPETGSAAPTRGDRILVAVFVTWAALLFVATLAQLFGWEGVLDVMDVKRWFAN